MKPSMRGFHRRRPSHRHLLINRIRGDEAEPRLVESVFWEGDAATAPWSHDDMTSGDQIVFDGFI